MYLLVKIILTSAIIVLVSEVAKKSTLAAALLASVPLVSILAITWVFVETRDIEKVSQLTFNIFWLVLPSLAFFIALPIFLNRDFSFLVSLISSITITIILYFAFVASLKYFGVKL